MKPRDASTIVAHAQKIGIVRTDRLGDVVLTLPLARALKEAFPAAEVAFIAHRRVAPLVEGCGVVDRCFYVDQVPLVTLFRREQFDVAFFPRARPEEVWYAWRAGIPLRIGTAYRWWSMLYNVRIHDHRSDAIFHEAEYNVRMLEHITQQRYRVELVPPPVADIARTAATTLLRQAGWHENEPFIVLHPGGSGSAPQWTKFPVLAQLLAQMLPGYRIVVTGTGAEEALCRKIVAAVGSVVNLCNRTSLEQLIAVLEKAAAVVANSTGVLHIAAALRRPVVGLYVAEPPALSPARWGPLAPNRYVLAATPIDAIAPEQVADAVCAVIATDCQQR